MDKKMLIQLDEKTWISPIEVTKIEAGKDAALITMKDGSVYAVSGDSDTKTIANSLVETVNASIFKSKKML
jgi:hypothetical protein